MSSAQQDDVGALAGRIMQSDQETMTTVDSFSRCSMVYEIGAKMNEEDEALAEALLTAADSLRTVAVALLARRNQSEAELDPPAYIMSVLQGSVRELVALVENDDLEGFQKEYEVCLALEELRMRLAQEIARDWGDR